MPAPAGMSQGSPREGAASPPMAGSITPSGAVPRRPRWGCGGSRSFGRPAAASVGRGREGPLHELPQEQVLPDDHVRRGERLVRDDAAPDHGRDHVGEGAEIDGLARRMGRGDLVENPEEPRPSGAG